MQDANTSIGKSITTTVPPVYLAVRSVGILKPEPQTSPNGLIFANSLRVVGTAFWLKDSRVLFTCAHVVRDLIGVPMQLAGFLYVGSHAGEYKRAVIGAIDFDHDLAILRLVDTPEDFVATEASTGLGLVDAYPEVGTKVAYAGFPYGDQLLMASSAPTYAEGVVGAKIRQNGVRKEIQITGAVAGGFSGSPVVCSNDPSKVVGILSNGPDGQGANNIFMSISWEHVTRLLELAKS